MQLFSKPHRIHARITKREPVLKPRLDIPSKDRRMHAAVTNTMPSHSLEDMASLKITRAITAVATISKLFSSEAFAADVILSPNKRHMGAAISRTIMAITKESSFTVSLDSFSGLFVMFLHKSIASIPSPAPTYKNPAINVEGIYSRSILDIGALSAYSPAASIAKKIPCLISDFIL